MRKYLLLILMLHFVSVIHAQITISMHIDYIQNNDTILKDTIVPYLRINFQNNTDTAQYFVLNNYDLYCEFCHDRMYLNNPKIGQVFQVYLYRRKD